MEVPSIARPSRWLSAAPAAARRPARREHTSAPVPQAPQPWRCIHRGKLDKGGGLTGNSGGGPATSTATMLPSSSRATGPPPAPPRPRPRHPPRPPPRAAMPSSRMRKQLCRDVLERCTQVQGGALAACQAGPAGGFAEGQGTSRGFVHRRTAFTRIYWARRSSTCTCTVAC